MVVMISTSRLGPDFLGDRLDVSASAFFNADSADGPADDPERRSRSLDEFEGHGRAIVEPLNVDVRKDDDAAKLAPDAVLARHLMDRRLAYAREYGPGEVARAPEHRRSLINPARAGWHRRGSPSTTARLDCACSLSTRWT